MIKKKFLPPLSKLLHSLYMAYNFSFLNSVLILLKRKVNLFYSVVSSYYFFISFSVSWMLLISAELILFFKSFQFHPHTLDFPNPSLSKTYTVVPWYPQGICSRTPRVTKIHICSSPSYEMVQYLHIIYINLPMYFKSSPDYL